LGIFSTRGQRPPYSARQTILILHARES